MDICEGREPLHFPSLRRAPLLRPNEVHVWRVLRDVRESVGAGLWEMLSPDERGDAGRFRLAVERRRFVAARGVLRTLLGAYAGMAPGTLRFQYGPAGKPSLACGAGAAAPPDFNVAHSGPLALIAVARNRALGVDLEEMLPLMEADALADRFFSAAEKVALRALPAERRLRGFYSCWTRKEAFIKATGEGLSRRLDSFDVSVGQHAALERVVDDPAEASRWSLRDIPIGAGYAATLAVATGIDPCVSLLQWEF
ncbi:MAG: 4'-phosphopantetheinyl transferase superfamily protein [Gemmatimonadaceae bacterium]